MSHDEEVRYGNFNYFDLQPEIRRDAQKNPAPAPREIAPRSPSFPTGGAGLTSAEKKLGRIIERVKRARTNEEPR